MQIGNFIRKKPEKCRLLSVALFCGSSLTWQRRNNLLYLIVAAVTVKIPVLFCSKTNLIRQPRWPLLTFQLFGYLLYHQISVVVSLPLQIQMSYLQPHSIYGITKPIDCRSEK